MDEQQNRPIYTGSLNDPRFSQESEGPPVEQRRIIPPGQMIDGKFRVIKMLGRGANGTVYEVEQILLKQEFAMKVLDPVTVTDDSWRRFQKEAQAAARLDHVGFVKVYDFGVIEQTTPYFTMDFVRGETLASRLERTGPLPLKDAIPIFTQLCLALDYAHSKGIIHRDLKPSNVAIFPTDTAGGDQVKILDFGIAKLVGGDATALTQVGSVFGTPFYMSPEQCNGDKVDQRSDVYSLGCMFFELLTGAPPFTSSNPLTLMMQHQNDRAPSLKEASMGQTFPKPIETIIQKMLAKDPNERYQSLSVTAKDLMAVQHGKVVNLPSETTPQMIEEKKEKRNTKFLFTSLALVAVIILLCGIIASLYNKNRILANQLALAPKSIETINPATDASLEPLPTPKEAMSYIPRAPYYSVIGPKRADGFEDRVFHFPLQWKIGTLTYMDGAKKTQREAIRDLKLLVRPNYPSLSLEVDWIAIASCPQLLAKFRPDEIGSIDLGGDNFAKSLIEDERAYNDAIHCIRDYKKIYALINFPMPCTNEAFDDLNKLKSLKYLTMAGSHMTGDKIAQLSYLPALIEFRCGGVKDAKLVLPHLFEANQTTNKNIKRFYFAKTDLQDSDLRYMARMPNLEELVIGHNPGVTDEGLKTLLPLHLKTLVLPGDRITPKAIDTLKRMKVSNELVITPTGWSTAEVQALAAAIAPCKLNPVAEANDVGKTKQIEELRGTTDLFSTKR